MKFRYMKKIYKQYSILLILALLCSLLAACGKEGREESGEKDKAEVNGAVIEGDVDQSDSDQGTTEKDAKAETDDEEEGDGEADAAQEPEPEPVVLDASYTTRFGEVNQVTFVSYTFDYPSSWQVISEEVAGESERVVLSDGKGAEICFAYYMDPVGGLGRSVWRADVEKIAESRFAAGMIQATDWSSLNPFMVAAVTPEGADKPTMYAVLPEAQAVTAGEFLGLPEVALRFDLAGWTSFVATGGESGFDEKEIQEALAILSSFRVT